MLGYIKTRSLSFSYSFLQLFFPQLKDCRLKKSYIWLVLAYSIQAYRISVRHFKGMEETDKQLNAARIAKRRR